MGWRTSYALVADPRAPYVIPRPTHRHLHPGEIYQLYRTRTGLRGHGPSQGTGQSRTGGACFLDESVASDLRQAWVRQLYPSSSHRPRQMTTCSKLINSTITSTIGFHFNARRYLASSTRQHDKAWSSVACTSASGMCGYSLNSLCRPSCASSASAAMTTDTLLFRWSTSSHVLPAARILAGFTSPTSASTAPTQGHPSSLSTLRTRTPASTVPRTSTSPTCMPTPLASTTGSSTIRMSNGCPTHAARCARPAASGSHTTVSRHGGHRSSDAVLSMLGSNREICEASLRRCSGLLPTVLHTLSSGQGDIQSCPHLQCLYVRECMYFAGSDLRFFLEARVRVHALTNFVEDGHEGYVMSSVRKLSVSHCRKFPGEDEERFGENHGKCFRRSKSCSVRCNLRVYACGVYRYSACT